MRALASARLPPATHLKAWRFAIGVVALLCALLGWHAHRSQSLASAQAAAEVGALAQDLATHQRLLLGQAEHLLQVLGSISLGPAWAHGCNTFLARQLEGFTQYDNLGFAAADGRVWCSARPVPSGLEVPTSAAADPHPMVFGHGGDGVWLALSGAGQSGTRVVAALARGAWFRVPAPHTTDDTVAALLGDDGRVLAMYPARSVLAGTLRTVERTALQTGAPLRLTDPSGHRWVAAAARIDGAAQPLRILVAQPDAVAAGPAPAGWVLLALLLTLPLLRPRAAPARSRGAPRKPAAGETTVLRGAYDALKQAYAANEQRMHEVTQLDSLSRRLQSCANAQDVAAALRQTARALLPCAHGWVQLRNARGRLETLEAWSPGAAPGPAPGEPGASTVRMPLYGRGEALGVLWLSGEGIAVHDPRLQGLVTAMAERASLALDAIAREQRLRADALRDSLTGLFNRRFLEEALAIEARRALRRGTPVGLMILDVDHFKRFNDDFGHDAGDALLRGLGALLQRSVREGDMACRYGGEEFVIILPGADRAHTQERAEALRAAIAGARLAHDGRPLGAVTVSIGVAALPAAGTTWQAALKAADHALYAAKHAGRNRVIAA